MRCDLNSCRRANEEVHSEFSVEEDIADKQKQWISVALHTDSNPEPVSEQNGELFDVLYRFCITVFIVFIIIHYHLH